MIDMTPLDFENLELAISAHLNGPVEASTMSRIYAKSGGNIGLAISLVDATVRENLLVRRGSEWVAARDLWSSGMRAVLEGYLENLDKSTRDALEIIAIVGVAGLETVRKLVEWDTLELLEERSLIAFVNRGPSQLITVTPPLLVEYFRHEPLSTRQIRLTELIIDRLGSSSSSTATILTERSNSLHTATEPDALFVRLLHERARARRIVMAAEWEANATPATAVRYVAALMDTYTPAADTDIRRVIGSTDLLSGGIDDRAQLLSLRARWSAYVDHDLEAALQILEEGRDGLGPYSRTLDAVEVEIRHSIEALPDDFAEMLEVTDELPDAVKAELLEVQLLVLVSLARFSDAHRVATALSEIKDVDVTHRQKALKALAMIGEGRYQQAREMLVQALDEAHGYLDIDGVRTFGAALAICHLHSGDNVALDELLKTIFAAGDPTPFPAGTQRAFLAIGTLNAVRHGRIASAERFAAEVEHLPGQDGPMPVQSAAWATAQLRSFEGQSAEAARVLWESATKLWDRGARFAALVAFLAAAEIESTPERLDHITTCLSSTPDARVLQAHRDYLCAWAAQDGNATLDAAEELDRLGRIGVALSACEQALTLASEREDIELEARAKDIQTTIRHARGAAGYDVARFRAQSASLTEREKEVARLAATGLSNQEIAAHLVLSVRTVESHMHRVMRKLDLSSRHLLEENNAALL